jgi:hypothetical protein
MTTPTQDCEALAGLVFDTLFRSGMSPIDCLESCLSWTTELCSLIAAHAGDTTVFGQQDGVAVGGIEVAALLAGKLATIGREIAEMLYRAHCTCADESECQDTGESAP